MCPKQPYPRYVFFVCQRFRFGQLEYKLMHLGHGASKKAILHHWRHGNFHPAAIQSCFPAAYFQHNTLKAIVGITPSGATSSISKLFGESVSDWELTIQCGILELLEGDSVMADRGFMIADLLAAKGVNHQVNFTHSWQKMSQSEMYGWNCR